MMKLRDGTSTFKGDWQELAAQCEPGEGDES